MPKKKKRKKKKLKKSKKARKKVRKIKRSRKVKKFRRKIKKSKKKSRKSKKVRKINFKAPTYSKDSDGNTIIKVSLTQYLVYFKSVFKWSMSIYINCISIRLFLHSSHSSPLMFNFSRSKINYTSIFRVGSIPFL